MTWIATGTGAEPMTPDPLQSLAQGAGPVAKEGRRRARPEEPHRPVLREGRARRREGEDPQARPPRLLRAQRRRRGLSRARRPRPMTPAQAAKHKRKRRPEPEADASPRHEPSPAVSTLPLRPHNIRCMSSKDITSGRDRRGRGVRRAAAQPAGQPAQADDRPPDLRARRHRLARADLGSGQPGPGRDVPRGGAARRARGPARVLSRLRRMQVQHLGARRPGAGPADARRALRRRPDPDRPGAAACRRRGPAPAGAGAGVRRRLHGGERRRARPARRRARPARRARVHVPRGPRRRCGARLPAHRAS